MARKIRKQENPLIRQLLDTPEKFSFAQAVRLLRHPVLNDKLSIVFTSSDDMTFNSSELSRVSMDKEAGRVIISINFLGLLGSSSIFPEYQYHIDLDDNAEKSVLSDFFNIFHQSIIAMFVKANDFSNMAIYDERGELKHNGLARLLIGLSGVSKKIENKNDEQVHKLKLKFAPYYATHSRCKQGLVAILSNYFACVVKVDECQEAYEVIDALESPKFYSQQCKLGDYISLGRRRYYYQSKICIVLSELNQNQYNDFLPSGQQFTLLNKIINSYVDYELDYSIKLMLSNSEKISSALNKHCLARDAWLPSSNTSLTQAATFNID